VSLPRSVGHGGSTHGHARMAGVRLLNGISSQKAYRIDGQIGQGGGAGLVRHFLIGERV